MPRQRLDRFSIMQRRRAASGFLTEDVVAHCRYQMLNGLATPRQLAEVHGVSTRCMADIRRGDTWGWVAPQCMTNVPPPAANAAQPTAIADAAQASLASFMARFNPLITVIEPEADPAKAD